MPGPSPAIANEFIRRSASQGRQLTHMQLQKLVYISHGWNLAINAAPLTEDTPEAWDYGPVYRELWEALRSYGRGPVQREIAAGDYGFGIFMYGTDRDQVIHADLRQNETEIIDRVFSDYGRFHAFKLSALTHQEGSPWDEVYNNGGGRMTPIDNKLIRDHFIDLARRPRSAA